MKDDRVSDSEVLNSRLSAVRSVMLQKQLDALLITARVSSLYLSNFPCSNSTLFITARDALFLTDFRYLELASRQISHMEVRRITQHTTLELQDLVKAVRPRAIGFEGQTSFDEYQKLKKAVGRTRMVEAGAVVRDLRAVKTDSEVRKIAANQQLNEQIFQLSLKGAVPGVTELELQQQVRAEMLSRGVAEAFDTIVATGPNSSLPHALPARRKLKAGDFLLIDMGVKRNFYYSDMTRTLIMGSPSPRQRELYEVVLRAQQAALEKIRPGVTCVEVDAAARNLITEAGYGSYFGHGLGHGVGLEIHEAPTLNPRSADVLREGMVVTVEPGIYLPGFGGIRIEDLVVVTKNGFRNLTKQSKAFEVPGAR